MAKKSKKRKVKEIEGMLREVGMGIWEAGGIADQIEEWAKTGIPLCSPIFEGGPPPSGSCLRDGEIRGGRVFPRGERGGEG